MAKTQDGKYFRKGLGNKAAVAPMLHADYHSGLVEWFKHSGYRFGHGETEVRLAKEFGFCYGVDRAVEYAYECRDRFPDKKIWITGEIIHNPWVNRRLEEMGIHFISPPSGAKTGSPGVLNTKERLDAVAKDDVVLIPAFGMEQEDFLRLRDKGVILVDTTCGSVLSVWKSVERYAKEGFTAIIHGKSDHEETLATCSQVRKYDGAHYLVLRDEEQTHWVCDYIEGKVDSEWLMPKLEGAYSDGFDPAEHLQRFGLANQTTMLSSESLEIARMLRDAMARAHGEEHLLGHYKSFDTICSATQDRQDAVKQLLEEEIDLMVIIGGFNSSNTTHLLEICLPRTRAFHIEDADCLISPVWIRHKPLADSSPVLEDGWLTPEVKRIGVTAGASTPDSEVGSAISRILGFRGVDPEAVREIAAQGSEIAEETRARKGKPTEFPVNHPHKK